VLLGAVLLTNSNKMKIAVTVTVCHQIGMETWQDFHTSKVFEENSTIKEIDDWIKSIYPIGRIYETNINKMKK